MPRARLLALAAALLLAPAPALADCTISVTPVAFGTYTPTSDAVRDGVGSVRTDCRHNVSPGGISIGTGGSGSYATRRMLNGSSQLQYNLFMDAARTTVWGNGSGGTATVSPPISQSSGLRRIREAVIYGRIPARQNVRAGTYTDTMFVTVSF
jgi:spore coat protein U-like protein